MTTMSLGDKVWEEFYSMYEERRDANYELEVHFDRLALVKKDYDYRIEFQHNKKQCIAEITADNNSWIHLKSLYIAQEHDMFSRNTEDIVKDLLTMLKTNYKFKEDPVVCYEFSDNEYKNITIDGTWREKIPSTNYNGDFHMNCWVSAYALGLDLEMYVSKESLINFINMIEGAVGNTNKRITEEEGPLQFCE